MKRHLRWIIPVVCIPVTFFGASFAAYIVEGDGLGASLLTLVLVLLAFLLPIASAIVALVAGIRTFNRWSSTRGKRGRLIASERAAFESGWEHARTLRRQIVSREALPAVRVWDLVLNEAETVLLDVDADFARFYGQNVSYSQTSGIYFGRPAFVLAGLALGSIDNMNRRTAAEAQAWAQWRERQPVRVLASNQRLACFVQGQWLSFYYSAMTAVYPEVENWTLVCTFDRAEPLMLSGEESPSLALLTVLATFGPDAVAEHPSLQSLDDSGVVV